MSQPTPHGGPPPADAASLFLNAAEFDAAADRAAYLDRCCGENTDLRAEVEALLRAHDDAGSFLLGPAPVDPALERTVDGPTARDVPGVTRMSEREDWPRTLGAYEILESVGRGGMGVVLKARDPHLHRTVAIKTLAPEFAGNATARKRFAREARAAAAVTHPHVVMIHAVEPDGPVPFLVMEYVAGRSLRQKLDADGALELPEILRIGSQIARGLAAAHGQGLIHRDVKPGNVLLENGVERVKLTDFGLARATDDVAITRTGDIAGTPQYMSPEQAEGKPADHRGDLFSLGSVLYAMCTGRPPFRGETAVTVLRKVCDETPRPIREVNPAIPAWLAAIVDRLLEKDPARRFQTAAEVADLLGDHLAHLQNPDSAVRPGPLTPHRRPPRVRRWAVAALVLTGVFAALGTTEATGVTDVVPTVVRLVRGDGTLVIETDDPGVGVTVEAEGDVVITGTGLGELRLKPGDYTVKATKDGREFAEVVTVARNGREVVDVRWEPSLPARSHTAGQTDAGVGTDARELVKGLTLVRQFPGHDGPVASVAFSPDGSRAASGSGWPTGDRTARIWDVSTGELLRTLRLDEHVQAVAFSAGGDRLLTGGSEGETVLWDVASGTRIREFDRATGFIAHLTFGAGDRFAAGTTRRPEGQLVVWDAATGKITANFLLGADGDGLAVHPDDDRLVAAAMRDGAVRLIDLELGAEVRRFGRPDDGGDRTRFGGVAFSPDGTTLAAGGPDVIRLWDFATGERLRDLPWSGWNLAFTRDGRSLVVTAPTKGSFLRVVDATTGTEIAVSPALRGHGWGVALSPDRRSVLTGGGAYPDAGWHRTGDYALRLWRLPENAVDPSGDFPHRFTRDDTPLNSTGVAWDESERAWRIDGMSGRTVRLFEVPLPNVDDRVLHYRAKLKSEGVTGRAYLEMWVRAPNGRKYFSRGFTDAVSGTTDWVDARTPFLLREGEAADLAQLNLVVEGDGTVWVKDVELDSGPRPLGAWEKFGEWFGSASGTPAGSADAADHDRLVKLAEAGYAEVKERVEQGEVSRAELLEARRQLLGAKFRRAEARDRHEEAAEQLAGMIELSEQRLAMTRAQIEMGDRPAAAVRDVERELLEARIRLREYRRGHDLTESADPPGFIEDVRLDGHEKYVLALGYTPDGNRLVSGGAEHLFLWDTRNGRRVRELPGHTRGIHSVAVFPDGERVASAGKGDAIVLSDLNTGEVLRRFTGHTGFIQSLAVSADGTRLASGSADWERGDRTVRVWDVETGKELWQAEVPHSGNADGTGAVHGVAFTPDGTRLLSAHNAPADGISVWDAGTGELLRRFSGTLSSIKCMSLSPDGRTLATGHAAVDVKRLRWDDPANAVIRLWDLGSGEEIRRLVGHTGGILAVDFSSDGRTLLSCSGGQFKNDDFIVPSLSRDNTLRVWDVATGRELARQPLAEQGQTAMFAPDGRQIASASAPGEDPIVQLWRLPEKVDSPTAALEAPRPPHGVPEWVGEDLPFDPRPYFTVPEENAAPIYMRAFEEISQDVFAGTREYTAEQQAILERNRERERRLAEVLERFRADPSSVESAEVEAVLTTFGPALDLVREAQRKPACAFPLPLQDLNSIAFSSRHLSGARQVAKILELKSARAVARGRFAEATGAVESLLRLARDLRPRGDALCQFTTYLLVRRAVEDLVPRILAAPELTAADRERLRAVLAAHRRASELDPVLVAEGYEQLSWRKRLHQLETGTFDPAAVAEQYGMKLNLPLPGPVLMVVLHDALGYDVNGEVVRRIAEDMAEANPEAARVLGRIREKRDPEVGEKFDRVLAAMTLNFVLARMTPLDYAVERRTLDRRHPQVVRIREAAPPERVVGLEPLDDRWTLDFPRETPKFLGLFEPERLSRLAENQHRTDRLLDAAILRTAAPAGKVAPDPADLHRLVELAEAEWERTRTLHERGLVAIGAVREAERAALSAWVREAEALGDRDGLIDRLRRLVRLAEGGLSNVRKLREEGIVPGAEVDAAEARLIEARLRLRAAEGAPTSPDPAAPTPDPAHR